MLSLNRLNDLATDEEDELKKNLLAAPIGAALINETSDTPFAKRPEVRLLGLLPGKPA